MEDEELYKKEELKEEKPRGRVQNPPANIIVLSDDENDEEDLAYAAAVAQRSNT
jgi:hypothetical protein